MPDITLSTRQNKSIPISFGLGVRATATLVPPAFRPYRLITGARPGLSFRAMDGQVFTDAGTTRATWGDAVQQVAFQGASGLALTQSNPANRPIFGRYPRGGIRNLVNAGRTFSVFRITETPNAITVNGEPFRRYTEDTSLASAGQRYFADTIYSVVAGRTYIVSMRAIGGEGRHLAIGDQSATNNFGVSFNLDTGAVGSIVGDTNPIAGRAADGRYWLRFTANATETMGLQYRMVTNPAVSFETYDGNGSSGFWVGRISFEEAAGATGPSPEQIRTSAFDITQSGVPDFRYLQFNGVNQFMSTASFDLSAFTNAWLFMLGEKLDDASAFYATSHGTDVNGHIGIHKVIENAQWSARTREGGAAITATKLNAPAPDLAVIAAQIDRVGDITRIYYNGAIADTNTTALTGNMLNAAFSWGALSSGTVPFNGRIAETLLIPNLSAAEAARVNTYLMQQGGIA